MAYAVLACTGLFALVYARSVQHTLFGGHLPVEGAALLIFAAVVEIGASFYAFAAIFSAIAYLLMSDRESPPQRELPSPLPP
jgi:hypothetical protein